ncbi:hypothetical protein HQ36_00605 [Porphyromonas gingivicanis]|uniref:Cell division protein FtsQ n=1 Tax=Porphyromonas gingivicanis TaxID=266762 RepID=A0A0A2G6W8_9PORP|nr:hypothetical protein [Porphyromonas gingivicanis]KGN99018.1 hypothetical protein HQ36_00605 [Porphyromonas gingivicanis]
MIKKILIRIGILLCIAFLLYLALTIPQRKQEVTIQNIEAHVKEGETPKFVNEVQLIEDVKKLKPDLIGFRADSVNLSALEQSLLKNTLFKEVNIFYTTKGTLHVEVTQRDPFFIVSTPKASYYVTRDREIIPLHPQEQYSFPLMVVHGHVLAESATGSIYDLMLHISKDAFWNSFFTSLYVTAPEKQLIAQTRIAGLEVNFGAMQEWKRKLWQLRTFLDKVIPQLGWGAFNSIYLEYPDRVITVPTHDTSISLHQDSIFSQQ